LKVKEYVQIQKLQLQHGSWQDSDWMASLVESEVSAFACRPALEDSDPWGWWNLSCNLLII
jgi:hypothetical protein